MNKYFLKKITKTTKIILGMSVIISLICGNFLLRTNLPTVQAVADSTLYFTPASTSVTSGSSFSMTAMTSPGSHLVSVVELHITYDQTKLQLNSIVASTTFTQILGGPTIPGNGTAYIAVGTPFGASTTVASPVAIFNFQALATTTNSAVAFTVASIVAGDDEPGVNQLNTRTSGLVTVTAPDLTAPTGGSISYINTYASSTSAALTVDDGTDPSGIQTSSRTVQRHSATLTAGSCGSYGSWSTITPSGSYPNFTDTTMASGNCYQYQYLVSDNATAHNQATYTSSSVIRNDTTLPSGGSISYVNSLINAASSSVNLLVNDGSDTVVGINTSSRTVQKRTATLTGTSTCGSYGAWTTITPTGTYPNFTDASIATANCYQYQYLVKDNAGNQTTNTSANTIRTDFVAPTISQVTAIASTTYSTAPSYTLTTNESGTFTLVGDCGASNLTATSGSNTITFNTMTVGTHSNCSVRVTDTAGNLSNLLTIPSFAITYTSDLNMDHAVNASDFSILHAYFGTNNASADINIDGTVNSLDFSILHAYFGQSF